MTHNFKSRKHNDRRAEVAGGEDRERTFIKIPFGDRIIAIQNRRTRTRRITMSVLDLTKIDYGQIADID